MNKFWQFLVTHKWWVLAIIVIIILIIAYKKGWFNKKPSTENSETHTTPSGTSSPWRDDSLPLSKGSKGKRVEDLQKALNTIIRGTKLATDGLFGSKTEEAVNKFKLAAHIPTGADGKGSESEYIAFVQPVISGQSNNPFNVFGLATLTINMA